MPLNIIDPEESLRLHMDWWGQCRTCRFWQTEPVIEHGVTTRGNLVRANCGSTTSDMSGKETTSSGHCKWWDSFDAAVALKVMEL